MQFYMWARGCLALRKVLLSNSAVVCADDDFHNRHTLVPLWFGLQKICAS